MDNISYMLFICVAVSLLFMLPLVEKQIRHVVIYIIIGAFMCVSVSELNYLLLKFFDNDLVYVTTTITPVSEELAKAIPVLYYALFVSCDEKRLISIAFACGVGFSLMENLLIITDMPEVTVLFVLTRVLGSGLVHGLCTVMIGYGISFVGKRKKLFISGTFALLTLAIIYHASYNLLLTNDYFREAIFLPILTYIPVTVFYIKNKKKK